METAQTLEERLRATLHAAGCDGCLHAVNIESGVGVGLSPHQIAVAASVFKVPVALELYRQSAVEGLDLTEQIRLDAENRTTGPTGLSNAQDSATLSLRDLALLMLSISDNTATDAIIARVGLERVNATLQTLGLKNTVIRNDIRGLLESIANDAGVPSLDALGSLPPAEHEARLEGCRAFQPEHATHTTPYDMTCLLQRVWRDEAAPAEACAQVRGLMRYQASHRLALGFPSEVSVHAKSGSLMGWIRNEVGVVTYPDKSEYAVAVFTRAHKRLARQPAIDQAIGAVAALAVEDIRTRLENGN